MHDTRGWGLNHAGLAAGKLLSLPRGYETRKNDYGVSEKNPFSAVYMPFEIRGVVPMAPVARHAMPMCADRLPFPEIRQRSPKVSTLPKSAVTQYSPPPDGVLSAFPGVSCLPKGLVEGGISSFWRPRASWRRHLFCLCLLEGNRPSSPASARRLHCLICVLALAGFSQNSRSRGWWRETRLPSRLLGSTHGSRLSLWFRGAAFHPGSDHCFLSPTSLGFL